MKNLAFLLLLVLGLAACNQQSISEDAEFFGEKISKDGAIEAAQFFEVFSEGDSVEMVITGSIKEVCKKKGCWMSMPIGEDQELLVRFKDYGFFVPLNADGRTATIAGWAYKEVVPALELKHLAFDAGKSDEEIAAITEDEVSYSFMAHGVIIE